MGYYSLTGDADFIESGGINTSLSNVTLQSPGTVSKSSWFELIASTSSAANEVLISIVPGTSVQYVIDIGIGGAGSEVVVVPNLLTGKSGQSTGHFLTIPLTIPSGSRVSWRVISQGNSQVGVGVHLFFRTYSTESPLDDLISYGVDPDSASQYGTTVDPGGTSNTKGAYAEISSSVSKGNFVTLAFSNDNQSSTTNGPLLIDLATGGAGSEVVIVPDLAINYESTEFMRQPYTVIEVAVASGDRISIRAQSTNASSDRNFDVGLYVGVGPEPATVPGIGASFKIIEAVTIFQAGRR